MNKFNPKITAMDGADNLLIHCLGVERQENVILVIEPDETLYKRSVNEVILQRCEALGANVTVFKEALIRHSDDFPTTLANAMRCADHTLFLSRLGDYVRFIELPGHCSKTTSYTYNLQQLASPYASIHHQLMHNLLSKLEKELLTAKRWHITCPLGTSLRGTFCWPSHGGGNDNEILVALFPVSTFKPIPCDTAHGTVALSRWLMPGGAPKVESPGLALYDTVYAEVLNGHIQHFYGSPQATDVTAHYERIASTLGINRNRVHSWHVGINPQTFFGTAADDDFDHWCAISFASPRYLHFHTCGDDPPGEVAWSLFNCSIVIDGETYWQNGEFVWLQRHDNRQLITRYSGADALLNPSCPIGL